MSKEQTERLPAISNQVAKVENNAIAEAAIQREYAEIQAAIAIAKRFPRNQAQALDNILIACQRPELAEKGLYNYARGGSDISGASIRLAETISQNWGNMDFGVRELDQRNGESTVEAYAWDMETNTRHRKVFQVKHIRKTKQGSYALTDPRDIYEMVANNAARRLRACILGIIPKDIIDAAERQCEETLKASADTTPEAIKKLLAAFEKFDVSRHQIEVRIQRKIESITPAQVVSLRKIYNSLKDGMSVAADWFEPHKIQEGETKGDTIKAKLRQSASKAPEPPVEAQTIETQPDTPPIPETPVVGDPGDPADWEKVVYLAGEGAKDEAVKIYDSIKYKVTEEQREIMIKALEDIE